MPQKEDKGGKKKDMSDPVHNPSHYKSGGIEVIDVIEAFELNFRLANVIKYVLRAGRKGDALEDLEKAAWYLNREIEKLKKSTSDEKAPKMIMASNTSSGWTSRELTADEVSQVESFTKALNRVVPIGQREYDG